MMRPAVRPANWMKPWSSTAPPAPSKRSALMRMNERSVPYSVAVRASNATEPRAKKLMSSCKRLGAKALFSPNRYSART